MSAGGGDAREGAYSVPRQPPCTAASTRSLPTPHSPSAQASGDVITQQATSAFSIRTSGAPAAAATPSPPARLASLKQGLSRALSRTLPAEEVVEGGGATDEAKGESLWVGGKGGEKALPCRMRRQPSLTPHNPPHSSPAAATLAPTPGMRRIKSRVSDDFPLLLTRQSPPAGAQPAACAACAAVPTSPHSRWRATIDRCIVNHKIVIREPSVHGGDAVPPAVVAAAAAFTAAAADAAADRAAAVTDDEVRREIHFSGGSARLLARAASRGCLVGMDE